MDYEEFDLPESHDPFETITEDEDSGHPTHQARVTVSLSWPQIALILSVNAILSLIISVAVFTFGGPNLPLGNRNVGLPGAPAAETEVLPIIETEEEASEPPSTLVTPVGATIPETTPLPGEPPPTRTPVEPTVYIVQTGDTLSNVASKFDVTLQDLMLANGLSDPDYVQVGQELVIPIGGLPVTTPTFTPIPVPTDTPLPFNPPTPLPSGTAPPVEPAATVGPTPTPVPTLTSATEAEIRLVLQALDPGDLTQEMVQIINQGPFVRLTGWTLSDEADHVYVFPDFSLWGGGAINIHTASGSNTTTDLYWGQPNTVWEIGELITLSDAEGKVITTYTVPEP
jgi:LysM repeat protein